MTACRAAMIIILTGAITTHTQAQTNMTIHKEQSATANSSATDSTTTTLPISLQELKVEGTRVVSRADGQTVYPTDIQKEHATSAYSLLQSIALPSLHVDETAQAITAPGEQGTVQIRINGVVAGTEEMLSLDSRAVQRIDYTERPGLRYGEGVARVINIVVKRPDCGHTIGANLTNTLTTADGNNTIFTRLNSGRNQWEASYSIGYTIGPSPRAQLSAAYTLPDNNISILTENSSNGSIRQSDHRATLTYNRTDSGRYVLQVKGYATIRRMPHNSQRGFTETDASRYDTWCTTRERSWSPALDIYWQLTGHRQTLTTNAVVTGISTQHTHNENDNGPYRYHISGRTWSVTAEAIYENRLKPFILSSGILYRRKHTSNTYTGDASGQNKSMYQTIYAFSQLQGNIARLQYTAGMGISNARNSRPAYSDNFFLARPKLMIAYPMGHGLKLSYSFEMSQHISAIANTNDITLRRNAMEAERGNPHLRPNRVTEHAMRLSLAGKRLSGYAEIYYKLNDHPNMAQYSRENDDNGNTLFIYTQRNQPGIDMLAGIVYASGDIIPGKLNIMCQGGIYRCFNYGDTYRHFYTAFNGTCAVTAWLGPLTLSAYADNGFRWMEGETRGHQGAGTGISARYRHGNISVALHWQQPLQTNVRVLHTETISRYVTKTTNIYAPDDANRLSLNLTYTFSRGRRYHDINRTITHTDRDTGIMK